MNAQIELFISEKSRTEAILNLQKARDIDPTNRARAEKWLQTLAILERYKPLKGRWIIGLSRMGVDTVLGSDTESRQYKEIAHLLFAKPPTELNQGDALDLAILFEHFIQGNDLFVTRDGKNKMLQKSHQLQQQWSILVCTPIDAIERLEPTLGKPLGAG